MNLQWENYDWVPAEKNNVFLHNPEPSYLNHEQTLTLLSAPRCNHYPFFQHKGHCFHGDWSGWMERFQLKFPGDENQTMLHGSVRIYYFGIYSISHPIFFFQVYSPLWWTICKRIMYMCKWFVNYLPFLFSHNCYMKPLRGSRAL